MKKHPQPSHQKLWLWGKHAVQAALDNPKRKVFRVETKELQRFLPEGAVHQGIAAEVAPLPEEPNTLLQQAKTGVVLVLDQVTDPHNIGAMLRTARALGALGVVLCERGCPPLSGVLAKSASGALDLIPVWKATNLARFLEDLKDMGFWTVGLDERGTQTISEADLPKKVALVMGAEGEGLRHLTQEKCDFLLKLPTDPEFPTLNVSVACALALYEIKTQLT